MITDVTVAKETWLFLYSIALGGLLSAAYDLLRVLRLEVRHRPAAVSAQDILYFFICGFFSFGFILKTNSGDVRIFILFGEAVGWTIWHFTLGELIVRVCAAAVEIVKKVLGFFIKLFLRPIAAVGRGIFAIIKRLCQPLWRNVHSFLKKVVQKEKYNLKEKRIVLYNLISRFIHTRQKGGDSDGTASGSTKRRKKKKTLRQLQPSAGDGDGCFYRNLLLQNRRHSDKDF